MIDLTICIPTYNRKDDFIRCLNSVTHQSGFTAFKILISDNKSTEDYAYQICKDIKDHRITCITQPENIGAFNNFKFLVQYCDTEYIMFLADDDYISSNYVEECFKFILKNSDYASCRGKGYYFDSTDSSKIICIDNDGSIQSSSVKKRILKYFLNVSLNTHFYGITKTTYIKEIFSSLEDSIGSDWVHVSHLAFRGKLNVLPNTIIYRSLNGASKDLSSLVKFYKIEPHEFETQLSNSIIKNFNKLSKSYSYFDMKILKFIKIILLLKRFRIYKLYRLYLKHKSSFIT